MKRMKLLLLAMLLLVNLFPAIAEATAKGESNEDPATVTTLSVTTQEEASKEELKSMSVDETEELLLNILLGVLCAIVILIVACICVGVKMRRKRRYNRRKRT